METVKAKVMVMHSAALLFEPSYAKAATERHKRHKTHKKHKTAEESLLCFLCFFVASSLLRGKFSFLLFVKSLVVFLEPGFEIV